MRIEGSRARARARAWAARLGLSKAGVAAGATRSIGALHDRSS
jgi:hypothetical protein